MMYVHICISSDGRIGNALVSWLSDVYAGPVMLCPHGACHAWTAVCAASVVSPRAV